MHMGSFQTFRIMPYTYETILQEPEMASYGYEGISEPRKRGTRVMTGRNVFMG